MKNSEERFFNSLSMELCASYTKLEKLRRSSSSWEEAFNRLRLKRDVEKDWEIVEKVGLSLILFKNPAYPPLLKQIPFPPFGLYVKGKLRASARRVAIVGTRKATASGLDMARQLAKEICLAGAEVVSGLALGIDAAAHLGAVEVNRPTLAVLARGLDEIYPRQNTALAKKIIEQGGCLVSEYPPKTPALPRLFLERNRIVSGLSEAVLIVEAPKRSGTLSTARFSTEQNREVFVVPGSPRQIQYQGSLDLIKSGAQIITEASDVLDFLKIGYSQNFAKTNSPLAENEKLVLNVLTRFGRAATIEEVAAKTGLSVIQLNEILPSLLISGLATEELGRYQIN